MILRFRTTIIWTWIICIICICLPPQVSLTANICYVIVSTLVNCLIVGFFELRSKANMDKIDRIEAAAADLFEKTHKQMNEEGDKLAKEGKSLIEIEQRRQQIWEQAHSKWPEIRRKLK